jgi:NitT/TauT family transport system ATP-binding protein
VESDRVQETTAGRLRVHIRRKAFQTPPTVALDGLTFEVGAGEFLAIVGPSGAGKSTLLNIVAGLERDYEGTVALGAGDAPLAASRLAYVFQTPRLMPWLSVLDNIRLVLSREARQARVADEILVEVGLEGFEEAYPGQLSGGMQRRVALARAFCVNPGLLLMDEPFASLDDPLAWRLRGQLSELWRRHRPTVLFVTHDVTEALSLADRVLFLSPRPGRLVHEQPIDLPHPRGRENREVERLRAELLALHPELLSGRVGEASDTLASPARESTLQASAT